MPGELFALLPGLAVVYRTLTSANACRLLTNCLLLGLVLVPSYSTAQTSCDTQRWNQAGFTFGTLTLSGSGAGTLSIGSPVQVTDAYSISESDQFTISPADLFGLFGAARGTVTFSLDEDVNFPTAAAGSSVPVTVEQILHLAYSGPAIASFRLFFDPTSCSYAFSLQDTFLQLAPVSRTFTEVKSDGTVAGFTDTTFYNWSGVLVSSQPLPASGLSLAGSLQVPGTSRILPQAGVFVGGTETLMVTWGFTFGPPPPPAPDTDHGPCTKGCCPEMVGGPVNITTGNMYTQQDDLSYSSVFGNFGFTRTYNSHSTFQGPLGLGWMHPFLFEIREVQPFSISSTGGVIPSLAPIPPFFQVRNGAGSIRLYQLIAGSSDTYKIVAPARGTSTLVRTLTGFIEQEQDGLRREFDAAGNLLQITNRAGHSTVLSYTGGQLTSVTDPGGRTLTFTYTGDRLTRVEGPGGLFAAYDYDTLGQLTTMTDAVGVRYRYIYTTTTPGRLSRVVDGNGNIVEQHTYDAQDRVVATTGDGGTAGRTIEYLSTTQTRVTDSLGRVTTYTFGMFGGELQVTQVNGPCSCGSDDSTRTYDGQGRLLTVTDARGNTTTFAYDSTGNMTSVTDALGHASTATYNNFGQVTTLTDRIGAATTFEYHPVTGVLLRVVNALGSVGTITPDTNHLPHVVTDPRGIPTTLSYGLDGLLNAITDSAGTTTRYTYDPAGRLIVVTDALGNKIGLTYDARSQVLSITDSIGALTTAAYDSAGNRVRHTDANGRVTLATYDSANRLIAVTDAKGQVTRYSYDTESNLLTVQDAKGQTTSFAYDDHNRVIRRTDPLGAFETFAYDAKGNLVNRTDRKMQTIRTVYDSLDREIAKTLPDGNVVTYEYDSVGRLLTTTDTRIDGILMFGYDKLGRVVSTTDQFGRVLGAVYDPAGNRTELHDDAGAVFRYAYDSRNLLTTLTDPRTGAFNFSYDALGRRTSLTRPNGTESTYAYDPTSRLTRLDHGGILASLDTQVYSYDSVGNRISDTRAGISRQYAYDPLDELTGVLRVAGSDRTRPEETFTYDAAGNRLTAPAATSTVYDAANRLLTDGARSYSYDANGNLTSARDLVTGAVATYTYDAEDRLIAVSSPDAEVTFQYDPLDRRITKNIVRWTGQAAGVVSYLYDEDDVLATFSTIALRSARFTSGPDVDEPLAEVRPDAARFYHEDVLGSIAAVSRDRGTLDRHYDYSAFGVPRNHMDDVQPYRFTGREWDPETRLYYYRARYYDATTGRFIGEDVAGGGLNLYAYVKNSATNFVDPSGLRPGDRHNPKGKQQPGKAGKKSTRCGDLLDPRTARAFLDKINPKRGGKTCPNNNCPATGARAFDFLGGKHPVAAACAGDSFDIEGTYGEEKFQSLAKIAEELTEEGQYVGVMAQEQVHGDYPPGTGLWEPHHYFTMIRCSGKAYIFDPYGQGRFTNDFDQFVKDLGRVGDVLKWNAYSIRTPTAPTP